MIYTCLNGQQYHLDDDVANNAWEMAKLDYEYAQRARAISIQCHKDVFYCLKTKDSGDQIYIQANYFIIPVEREEIERIIELYNESHYIGIIYLR